MLRGKPEIIGGPGALERRAGALLGTSALSSPMDPRPATTFNLAGPVVLDWGGGLRLRIEPEARALGPVASVESRFGAATAEHETRVAARGTALEPASGAVEWFRTFWCRPQGHSHDALTELGCMISVLAALRGEDARLRQQVLDQGQQPSKAKGPPAQAEPGRASHTGVRKRSQRRRD